MDVIVADVSFVNAEASVRLPIPCIVIAGAGVKLPVQCDVNAEACVRLAVACVKLPIKDE